MSPRHPSGRLEPLPEMPPTSHLLGVWFLQQLQQLSTPSLRLLRIQLLAIVGAQSDTFLTHASMTAESFEAETLCMYSMWETAAAARPAPKAGGGKAGKKGKGQDKGEESSASGAGSGKGAAAVTSGCSGCVRAGHPLR